MAPQNGSASVRALLFLPIMLGILTTPAGAESLEVVGYLGYLGEWELTATVAENVSSVPKEYAGPLTMKHVGLCTQDGPEEKTGDMRFRILSSSSRLDATISVAGVECRYSGKLSDSYTGTMNCPDRDPVPLKLWVK